MYNVFVYVVEFEMTDVMSKLLEILRTGHKIIQKRYALSNASSDTAAFVECIKPRIHDNGFFCRVPFKSFVDVTSYMTHDLLFAAELRLNPISFMHVC